MMGLRKYAYEHGNEPEYESGGALEGRPLTHAVFDISLTHCLAAVPCHFVYSRTACIYTWSYLVGKIVICGNQRLDSPFASHLLAAGGAHPSQSTDYS